MAEPRKGLRGRRNRNTEAARREIEAREKPAARPRRAPSQKPSEVDRRRAHALRLIEEKGYSYRKAAKETGTSAYRLRREARKLDLVESAGPRGVKLKESTYKTLTREMTTFSDGQRLTVRLSLEMAMANARYLNAVRDAVGGSNTKDLEGMIGLGIVDDGGNELIWETDVSVLKKLTPGPTVPMVYKLVKVNGSGK